MNQDDSKHEGNDVYAYFEELEIEKVKGRKIVDIVPVCEKGDYEQRLHYESSSISEGYLLIKLDNGTSIRIDSVGSLGDPYECVTLEVPDWQLIETPLDSE